jgi:pSer/pThr/pTyr-binding forkhead associated (FHA) protein
MPVRLRVVPSSDRLAGGERSPATERSVEFADEVTEIRIGRRPDLELPLPFKALSAVHARLICKRTSRHGLADGESDEQSTDVWSIEDMGSKNGTFIGKDRLERGAPRVITPGTRIALGHVNLVFDGFSPRTTGAEGTGTIARRLVSDLFMAAPETNAPTLTVVEGPSTGSVLRLVERDKPFTIGRTRSCSLRIKVHELSREHAAFTRGSSGVMVRDLDSKNGVRVNGVKVTESRLADGDTIDLGPVTLKLADPEDRYMRDIEAQQDNRPARPPAPAPVPATPARPYAAPAPSAIAHPHAAPRPAAHPHLAPSADGTSSGVRKSRFAPRPATLEGDLHPAIAAALVADRVQQPIVDERSRSVLQAPRGATFIAAAVLAGILAAVIVLVLGN